MIICALAAIIIIVGYVVLNNPRRSIATHGDTTSVNAPAPISSSTQVSDLETSTSSLKVYPQLVNWSKAMEILSQCKITDVDIHIGNQAGVKLKISGLQEAYQVEGMKDYNENDVVKKLELTKQVCKKPIEVVRIVSYPHPACCQ